MPCFHKFDDNWNCCDKDGNSKSIKSVKVGFKSVRMCNKLVKIRKNIQLQHFLPTESWSYRVGSCLAHKY
jgi:hypothetical protein